MDKSVFLFIINVYRVFLIVRVIYIKKKNKQLKNPLFNRLFSRYMNMQYEFLPKSDIPFVIYVHFLN